MNQPNQSQPDSQLNRRGFLKTTSTALVGTSLLGGLTIERSAFAAGDDTIKIALIGCGGRGSGAADQALSTAGNVKLVAMADVFPGHLKGSLANLKNAHGDRVDVPEERQFVGFDAYKKAIALADLVILATPPGFRPIHIEEAVNAGKNIFAEKPIAVDGPGIRKVMAAAQLAKQKGLRVGIGFQRHHQVGYLESMKRIHDGAIGDIVSMRCYWNGDRPWKHPRKPNVSEMEYQLDNWYYFTWLCGDHIVEQHIHNLDVVNWLKQGHPVKAYGMGGAAKPRTSDDGEIFDHHAVEFEYADGTRMYSQCRHIGNCWSSVAEHAQGTKGTIDLQDGGSFTIKGANAWSIRDRDFKPKSPYQVEHDDLFAAIRKNEPYFELDYGITSTMTAIMGRMATYSGKIITWDEAVNSPVSLAPETYAWDAKPQSLPDSNGMYGLPIPGDPKWVRKVV